MLCLTYVVSAGHYCKCKNKNEARARVVIYDVSNALMQQRGTIKIKLFQFDAQVMREREILHLYLCVFLFYLTNM